jgi:hypothetical protein
MTSARVASTPQRRRGQAALDLAPIDKSVRAATVSSDMARVRGKSRIRCPTATPSGQTKGQIMKLKLVKRQM